MHRFCWLLSLFKGQSSPGVCCAVFRSSVQVSEILAPCYSCLLCVHNSQMRCFLWDIDCNLPKNKGLVWKSKGGIVLPCMEGGGLFPHLVLYFKMVLGSKNENLLKCALSLLCLNIRLAGYRCGKYLFNLSWEHLSFFVSKLRKLTDFVSIFGYCFRTRKVYKRL